MNADPLEPAAYFPYLVRIFTFNNINWENLYQHLRKSWRWWGMVVKVLMRMGATVPAWAMLYKAVVQTVVLYGSKSWVVTG